MPQRCKAPPALWESLLQKCKVKQNVPDECRWCKHCWWGKISNNLPQNEHSINTTPNTISQLSSFPKALPKQKTESADLGTWRSQCWNWDQWPPQCRHWDNAKMGSNIYVVNTEKRSWHICVRIFVVILFPTEWLLKESLLCLLSFLPSFFLSDLHTF